MAKRGQNNGDRGGDHVFTFTTLTPDYDTIRKICAKWSLDPSEVVTLNEGRTPLAPGNVPPKDRPWREGSTMVLASEAQDNGRAFSGLEKRIEQECPSLLVESVRALGIAAIYLKRPPPPSLAGQSDCFVALVRRNQGPSSTNPTNNPTTKRTRRRLIGYQ